MTEYNELLTNHHSISTKYNDTEQNIMLNEQDNMSSGHNIILK